MKQNKTIVLIAFYNKKALGVRYLDAAMSQAGYAVRTIFYKDFNSIHPRATTQRELELLREQVGQPLLIGLSVMSSMYLDTVYRVMDTLRGCDAPIVCGGAYATMFPERLLERGAQYVIRGDGECTLRALADALRGRDGIADIPSLCCWQQGKMVIKELGGIKADVDKYGLPSVRCADACLIENDRLIPGDPQRTTRSYEVIASRGCPFTCSYCCCVNLRRLLPKNIPPVRTRSVQSVISELIQAKKECKRLAFVHFYDEIFPNLPGWVDEFTQAYQTHINLPFTIWSHPKMIDLEVLKKLKKIGLVEVIMGIQTGSERIRREVFHRYETQQDILRAVDAIHEAGVFWGSFDFMLQHPFERIEDLKESYRLVKQMRPPFELQLHGLNFLPGTDIVPMAIEQGYITAREMERIMYAPMQEQFSAYWKRETSPESRLWYQMIDCYQFRCFRRRLTAYEHDPLMHGAAIRRMYRWGQWLKKIRYVYKKGRIVLKKYAMRRHVKSDTFTTGSGYQQQL